MTHGTLTVTAGGGATISGNGTATLTHHRHGRADQRGARGLTYHGNLNFNGPDTLTVSTSDGTAQDTDTVAITVNPVNDAPVNTVPGAQSVNEDTTLPIAGLRLPMSTAGALTTDADGRARHAHRARRARAGVVRQRHRRP